MRRMQSQTSGKLTHFSCGTTRHDMRQILRDAPSEYRIFPAGVFLYEHHSGERVLFDTGYSSDIYAPSFKNMVYRKALPPEIDSQSEIHAQLKKREIEPSSIGHVVLSHLHPDHIGGVKYFPNASFVMGWAALSSLESPRLKEGIFRRLLPDWFSDANILSLDKDALTSLKLADIQGYDLFNDQSFVVTSLPGHARGHLGALVEQRVLLAGDASWGEDILPKAQDLRWLPSTILDDYPAYIATAHRLMALASDGVQLCFSHDQYKEETIIG